MSNVIIVTIIIIGCLLIVFGIIGFSSRRERRESARELRQQQRIERHNAIMAGEIHNRELLYPTQCCGLREITGLKNNPEDTMMAMCGDRLYLSLRSAFVTFTDTVKSGKGNSLRKYIIENNLGRVIESKAVTNPNSGSKLKVYTWTVNNVALDDWFNNKVEEL